MIMASVTVVDLAGAARGTMELPEAVFGGPVRGPVVHQAVVRELADRRAGTHASRGRSEVSGGGKKPWRQKGTGRARQGSIRATQWKGGGKPFGPKPRSYDQALPRAMRRAALRSAYAAKLAAGAVTVVERVEVEPRTRVLAAALRGLGATGPTLLVVAERSPGLDRAARNIAGLVVETPAHASAYQVMRCDRLLIERAAVAALEEQLTP
jgi:large subunit ribosomal protein L4